MMGPLLPLKSYVSSAADFATRTVDSALYEAIVARAINKSTSVLGKTRARVNGDSISRDENIILKALIEER